MAILSCDLGGTRMKIGVVDGGRVLAQTAVTANSKSNFAPVLPTLKSIWLKLLDESKINLSDCAGISIAFPSLIDVKSARVLDEYGKYADAVNFNFRDWAEKEFGLPLAIENDARMALAGEWKYGAGRGSENLIMITLGTGIGTAAIIEGKILRGKHGQAGVLGGHSSVRYDGRACNCGNIGCAEAEASTAFLRDIAENFPEWKSSSLTKLDDLNYATVFQHADAGDGCAEKIRNHSLRVWSTLAVNLIHAYDPETIIFGGGIMASANSILPAIRKFVKRHARTSWGKPRIVAGELGDAAALLAGEWLLQEQYLSTRSLKI